MTEHRDKTGVVGRRGAELPFGDGTVTVRILTNGEMKAQKDALGALEWIGDASPGQQIYDAHATRDDFGPLIRWLDAWVEGGMPEDRYDAAYADEVVRLIDAIFEQNGLNWLKRIMGNSSARQLAAQATQQTTTPGRDSTPSTSSSSESGARPATHESTSPATG